MEDHSHRIVSVVVKSLWAVVLVVFAAGCNPLEPLGSGDLAHDFNDDGSTSVGTPNSVIKSNVWNLGYVGRLQVPYGDIDPIYRDGKIPDTVNYEMEGSSIVRHRVLDWGQLQLGDNGYFRFILQYSRYAVQPGEDLGPTATCSADMRGIYSVRDETILLYPERLPNEHFSLALDFEGSLRGIQMPTTCNGFENGASFQSNILLKNLVMNPVRD